MFNTFRAGPEDLVYVGYLLAFILASITCLGAAWRARQIPYADTRRALVSFFGGSSVWGAAYVGFLLVPSPLGKHLFYQLSLLVGFATVWAWLWFCFAYSGRGLHRNKTVQRFAAVVYGGVTLLKVTNPLHGLYYGLESVGEPFGLVVVHGPLYWVVMALAYALSAAGYLVLYELFLKTGTRTGPLAVLTGLTALPAVFNVIGHVDQSFLDITHEPLGVAVFAVGLLFAYTYQFSAVRVAGSLEAPNLMLGNGDTIRDYGTGAAQMLPELGQRAIGEPLSSVLPGLAKALREDKQIWEKGRGPDAEYYRITETSLAGSPKSRIVILSDITQYERQRRALDRQNDLFRRAQSLADVGAWEYDLDNDQLRWSDEVYRIYGMAESFEPTLEKVIELTCPDDRPRTREALNQVIEDEAPQDLDVRLKRDTDGMSNCTGDDDSRSPSDPQVLAERDPDATVPAQWVRIRLVPRISDGPSPSENGRAHDDRSSSSTTRLIRGAVQDITEQKRREQRLRTAKTRAEEAAQLKSAMLANMSHEIRTPLTSIIGFAEALGEEADDQGGPTSRFATLIEQSGRRLMETLDGVLNLSKLEAGQMELASQPVDLSEQIQEVTEELRPKAEENNLDLDVELNGTTPWVEADTGGIQIVLQNLVSNAIKYTETGRIHIRVRDAGDTLALVVEDTGIGIDPDRVERLFEPFRQESEGIDREYEGTGLGLAVTKKAVDQMDGEIDVESTQEEGSRFTVRFPKARKPARTGRR